MSTSSVRQRRVLIVGTLLLIAAFMVSTALAAPPVAQDGPTTRLEAQADGFVSINYYAAHRCCPVGLCLRTVRSLVSSPVKHLKPQPARFSRIRQLVRPDRSRRAASTQ